MVVTVPYAVDLLTAVGFLYAEIDGDKFLIFSENEQNSIYRANLFCSTMEEELKKLEPPPFPVGIHSDSPTEATAKKAINTTSTTSAGETTKKTKSNDGDTLFLSDQERKERMIKVRKAKHSRKVEKDLSIKRWAEDKMERENRENNRKKMEANKGIGKNNAEAMTSIISSKYIKIRNLDEQTTSPSKNSSPPPSNRSDIAGDPNESLESIRAKAADAWNKKHKSNNKSINNNSKSGSDNDEDGDSVMLSSNNPDVKDVSDARDSYMDVEEEDDKTNLKPAAVPKSDLSQEVSDPILPDEINSTRQSWEESLDSIPRCGPAPGIRETSVFNTGTPIGNLYIFPSTLTHYTCTYMHNTHEDFITSFDIIYSLFRFATSCTFVVIDSYMFEAFIF